MKKTFFIIFLTLLFLTGCDNKLHYVEPNPIDTSDKKDFIYTSSSDTQNQVWQSNYITNSPLIHQAGKYLFVSRGGTIHRYNTETGNLTFACSDPVCLHLDSSCPFFSDNRFPLLLASFDDRLYFSVVEYQRDEKGNPLTDESSGILRNTYQKVYHIENQEVTISHRQYYDENAIIRNNYFTEDYEFYYDFAKEHEEDKEFRRYLYCYDVKTQKSRLIRDTTDEAQMIFCRLDGNKLYYQDQISIGWLDIHTGEKTAIYQGDCSNVACDTEYFYFTKTDFSLWRVDYSGKNLQSLGAENVRPDYYLTDNYVYYRHFEEDYRLDGQTFWRMNKDGSDKTEICHFEGTLCISGKFIIAGNYLYGRWIDFDENGLEINGDNPTETTYGSLLRVDLTTGEMYYIEIPKWL